LPQAAVSAAARLWATYDVVERDGVFGSIDGWRSGGEPAPLTVVMTDDTGHRWTSRLHPGDLADGGELAIVDRDGVAIAWEGQVWTLELPDPMRGGHQRGAATEADVVSPMPGTVLRVDVAEGDPVVTGQTLGVVEAMKMELPLVAPYDGTVTLVGAAVGDQVPIKHLLFTVAPA
jgi:acetyl-CoA/propionyl-CoA carboxylase biotin carboxyl carrier protein